jgi:high affinity Mn2+ porin
MRLLRALPALALLASAPCLAEPATDITLLLQSMQERLTRLEARNTELERRLAAPKDEALAARVEDVESELLSLRKKPDPLAKFAGFSAGASLTMVAQSASGNGSGNSQLSARADIEVEMPGGSIGAAEGKLFAHFRAGDGDGVAPATFATPNATAFGNNAPVLMQAWYQLDIPVGAAGGNLGQIEVTAGKIDPFGFFDGNNVSDDESEAFLNLAFVHNPLLDAGGDIGVGTHGASPGLRLAYVGDINGGNHVTASLGVFGAGTGADYGNSFHKPFSIAQLEYAGKTFAGLEGAYRLYAWNNAQAFDQVNDLDGNGEFDDTREKHAGWGISLDQKVGADTTLFARYGRSSKGTLAFDRAVTLGGQLTGKRWGREHDRLGLAYGWLASSAEMKAANPGFGSEKIAELFYVWQANEQFHLAPSVQWISQPGGDPAAKDITVLGLRAKAAF